MKSLVEYIHETFINEARYVTFGKNEVAPNDGWCIIMAGGGGSGKSTAVKNSILAGAHVQDVDQYKIKYLRNEAKYIHGITDRTEILKYVNRELSNPKRVSEVHSIIKSKNWKEKERELMIKSAQSASGILPNLFFDITGKDPEDFWEIINMVQPLGYNIKIIWIICNLNVARKANQARERKGDEKLLDMTHSKVYKTMTNHILDNPILSKNIDSLDLILMSNENRRLNNQEIQDSYFKCDKDSQGFHIPDRCAEFIERILKDTHEMSIKD